MVTPKFYGARSHQSWKFYLPREPQELLHPVKVPDSSLGMSKGKHIGLYRTSVALHRPDSPKGKVPVQEGRGQWQPVQIPA